MPMKVALNATFDGAFEAKFRHLLSKVVFEKKAPDDTSPNIRKTNRKSSLIRVSGRK